MGNKYFFNLKNIKFMCLSLGYGFLKNTLVDNTLHKIANHDPVVSHSIKPTLIGHQ